MCLSEASITHPCFSKIKWNLHKATQYKYKAVPDLDCASPSKSIFPGRKAPIQFFNWIFFLHHSLFPMVGYRSLLVPKVLCCTQNHTIVFIQFSRNQFWLVRSLHFPFTESLILCAHSVGYNWKLLLATRDMHALCLLKCANGLARFFFWQFTQHFWHLAKGIVF